MGLGLQKSVGVVNLFYSYLYHDHYYLHYDNVIVIISLLLVEMYHHYQF